MSPLSAREAVNIGYRNVRVLSSGLPGWKTAKGVVVMPRNGMKKMIHDQASYVLLDLRSKKAADAGHIKGAFSLPADQLAAARDKLPKDKSAPIILYNDGQASVEAFALVRGWGYKNATVLDGGAKAWDGRFFPGDTPTKITYVKKLKPGEITIAEFKKAVAGEMKDAVILDVRDAGTEGTIPGAITIPQTELANRATELPKDKEIIIHCNTGILASMAHKTMQQKGYKSRYVDAVVQVAADGSLEVSPK
jgi:rhodanese-related sulfurtransferase